MVLLLVTTICLFYINNDLLEDLGQSQTRERFFKEAARDNLVIMNGTYCTFYFTPKVITKENNYSYLLVQCDELNYVKMV
jgi:hypothetical protein